VSAASYVGVMVGPPLFGGIADAMGGLRWSLLVDGCMMAVIGVLACLVPRTR
jgi:MFS family permease